MAAHGIRRAWVAVAALAMAATVAAGCDTATTPAAATQGDIAGCDNWCGNGSAAVTIGGTTTTISGGGCFDTGSAGYDIRFGDWLGVQGVSGYLALTAYRVGGPTPTPAVTQNPLAAPSATDHSSPIASGSVDGSPFILGSDAVVTLNADLTGSFSGTDENGAGLVKGTYRCN